MFRAVYRSTPEDPTEFAAYVEKRVRAPDDERYTARNILSL
jgi:hypothetical protein